MSALLFTSGIEGTNTKVPEITWAVAYLEGIWGRQLHLGGAVLWRLLILEGRTFGSRRVPP